MEDRHDQAWEPGAYRSDSFSTRKDIRKDRAKGGKDEMKL